MKAKKPLQFYILLYYTQIKRPFQHILSILFLLCQKGFPPERPTFFLPVAWVAKFVGQCYNKKLSYRQEEPDGQATDNDTQRGAGAAEGIFRANPPALFGDAGPAAAGLRGYLRLPAERGGQPAAAGHDDRHGIWIYRGAGSGRPGSFQYLRRAGARGAAGFWQHRRADPR